MGVETAPLVAVRTMVGVETVSVRTLVGVETTPEVAVRVGVEVATGTMVRVEIVPEVTVRTSGVETALGPGFATVMLVAPACVAVPVAVSCVAELKIVVRGVPFHSTCAPLTKRLPTTLKENGPSGSGFGARLVVHGIWLRTVIRHFAEAAGFETLVAVAVTFQPAGGNAGAMYFPVASMTPTIELPPGIPLIVQATAVLAAPFTKAVNRRSPPTGTLTEVGETVTVWAIAGAAMATISGSKPSINRLWPYVRTFVLPARSGDTRIRSITCSITCSLHLRRRHNDCHS